MENEKPNGNGKNGGSKPKIPQQQVLIASDGIGEGVGAADILQAPGLTPQQKLILMEFHDGGELHGVLRALIGMRYAFTEKEAFQYLVEEVLAHAPLHNGDEEFRLGDLKTDRPTGLRQFLGKTLQQGSRGDQLSRICQHLGIIGHMFAAWITAGGLDVRDKMQLDLGFEPPARQLDLFGDELAGTRYSDEDGFLRPCDDEFGGGGIEFIPPSSSPIVTRQELSLLHAFGNGIEPFLSNDGIFATSAFAHAKDLLGFRNLFGVLFPDWVEYLERVTEGPMEAYLRYVTLLSWARLVISIAEQPLPYVARFPEIPVLRRRHVGFRAGRLDLLGIDSSTRRGGGLLRQMHRTKPASAFDVLQAVRSLSIPTRSKVIVDNKFKVGDFQGSLGNPDVLPSPKHVEQMMRYACLLHLAECKAGGRQPDWKEAAERQAAMRLLYIFPDAVREFPVKPEIDDLSKEFGKIVHRYGDIARTADMRRIASALTSHLSKLRSAADGVSARGAKPVFGSPLCEAQRHFTFKSGVESERRPHSLADLIKPFQVFADPHRIMQEVPGRDGEAQYLVHLDRLRQAIEDGKIAVGPTFDGEWQQDEFSVSCPAHKKRLGHEDGTPSMRVYRDHVFCFGCRAFGYFDYVSIPDDFHFAACSRARGHLRSGINDLQLSEEHIRIMRAAQESLQRHFASSAGWRYLVDTRCIDPDIAMHYGAGSATTTLLFDLMEAGFSFDQLLAYGFVEYSQNLTPGRWLEDFHEFLVHRGVNRQLLTKKVRTKTGNLVDSYAYFSWNNRLTFPLTIPIEGKPVINSFYGRATWDNPRIKHRKLRIAGATVQHGVFNGESLCACGDKPPKAVYVAEGAMDALVLLTMRLGGAPVIALASTGADLALRWLAHLKPETVRMALDFDAAGQQGTEVIKKHLVEKFKYRGTVENFCDTFAALHEEVDVLRNDDGSRRIDDFGTWWELLKPADRIEYIESWYEATGRKWDPRTRYCMDPPPLPEYFDDDVPF